MKLRRGEIIAVFVAMAAATAIDLIQPQLARRWTAVRIQTDTHNLPPPAHLKRLAFGYRSALVDLLWAKILVEQGLHWQDHRQFAELPSYIDGIIALEPEFKPIYEFVDTLLLFQYVPGTEREARLARAYLEEGTRARPYDPDVWLHYGQYLAFLAPSFLKDKTEIEQWRKDGAFAIAHSVELGADAQRSLAAFTILNESGERKAAIRQLQRSYALTTDPETRRQIRIKLTRLDMTVDAEGTVDVLERLWRSRYPFLSRGEVLLMGPLRDPAICAGHTRDDRECPTNWSVVAP